VLERLDPLPVVTPAQLELAAWMAEHTLTPLGTVLGLMLPPGLAKRGDTLYTLLDPEAEGQSATQIRILSLLRRRGPLRGRLLSFRAARTRCKAVERPDRARRGRIRAVLESTPSSQNHSALRTCHPRDIASRMSRRAWAGIRAAANILESCSAARGRRLS